MTFCDSTLFSLPGENGFVAVVKVDGRIAGFMEGYINERKKSLEVPRLAIDDAFSFYSPGMLLLNESVKWLIENSDVRIIDLCRGTEKYKIDMGGVVYHTRTICFHIGATKR